MKIKHLLTKTLLVAAGLCVGASNAWADTEWSTVWTADFASAPSGMTYSVTNGSTDISTGVLSLIQGGGSGNRAINIAFTDEAFTNNNCFSLEFDWGASASNQNTSTMTVLSDAVSPLLTISWE